MLHALARRGVVQLVARHGRCTLLQPTWRSGQPQFVLVGGAAALVGLARSGAVGGQANCRRSRPGGNRRRCWCCSRCCGTTWSERVRWPRRALARRAKAKLARLSDPPGRRPTGPAIQRFERPVLGNSFIIFCRSCSRRPPAEEQETGRSSSGHDLGRSAGRVQRPASGSDRFGPDKLWHCPDRNRWPA